MRRRPFYEQHPWLLMWGVFFGFGFVMAFWPLLLALAVLAGVGYGCYRLVEHQVRQNRIMAHQRAVLAWRADVEHWLWMRGDSRGMYGNWTYPPI